MEIENLVLIDQLCKHHNIEATFIHSLREFGLIDIVMVEDNQYLATEQLKDFEKMMRFHYDLNINIEGIDAITHLLHQIEDLQQELIATKNKLRLYYSGSQS